MRRFYRNYAFEGLVGFEVSYKQTDLFIEACKKMEYEVFQLVRDLRMKLDSYIEQNRDFLVSLKPVRQDRRAPAIAREMITEAAFAGVGPMACVAGAFADHVGRFILKHCSECIVENGGDIFLKLEREALIGVYTENPHFKDKLAVRLKCRQHPYGVCSSSAKIGPSLSLGRADLALIVSDNATRADALATRCANMIETPDDIERTIEFARSKGVLGCLFISQDRLGIWGDITLA